MLIRNVADIAISYNVYIYFMFAHSDGLKVAQYEYPARVFVYRYE